MSRDMDKILTGCFIPSETVKNGNVVKSDVQVYELCDNDIVIETSEHYMRLDRALAQSLYESLNVVLNGPQIKVIK